MGIAKNSKDEIAQCPPIAVLTGRRDDAWLDKWSRADAAVPHPRRSHLVERRGDRVVPARTP
jgi:hypothetical protein